MAKKNTPPTKLNADESLRADNELAALNLEMKYGAQMYSSGELPPEIYQMFLKNVASFEEQHLKGEKTSIYKFIGSPTYATPDLLEKSTISGEIERILQLLKEKDIIVTCPDDLSEFDYYTFLVEEIFPLEIDNIHISGMLKFFDYTEFHPDKKMLIAENVEHFLLRLLNLNQPFSSDLLCEICRDDHNTITHEEALQKINTFRGKYESIVPVAFRAEDLIEHGGTFQTFGIKWKGIPKSGGKEEEYEGLGIIQVFFERNEWLIQGVNMPGFSF
jgi:hypothetical protein